eukprot:15837_1
MSSSSGLWPNGNNKDLILAIANYLQTLSNQNQSTLDDVSFDSLQIATESLQTIVNPDDDTLPTAPFTLNALYESYLSKPTSAVEEKTEAPLPSNIEKRKTKFLEFIVVLKKHDFFKGAPEGSGSYRGRMEKARLQYNSRFPSMSIDSLDWITDKQGPQPMDEDTETTTVTAQDKARADAAKQEGNKLLGQKQYQKAIDKYTAAIEANPVDAVYYSNRAAAYTYLKQFKKAVADARKASSINPEYVKAYIREGLAEYEMKHYQKAHDAYSKALNKTKSTDKNWENYMEKVQLCQMKIDEANQMDQGKPRGGGQGGAPDLSSLLGSLGGGGPDGGMDFSKLLQNPMMQQMAQQMMQDPSAMQKMGDLVNSMGGAPRGGGGGDASGAQDANWMSDLMQNPDKAKAIFAQAMEDPEVQDMMSADPSIAPLINRVKSGDQTAFLELGTKPDVMAKVQQLIQKYYQQQ